MAGYLSSRQGAGAQEYGLYFKLLQRSIGGRDPAYAVAFDLCNGRYPSCSSQAARKWYGPCPWRGAFSRGRPSLWPRKHSFFSVTAFLMAISINRLIGFVNGWFSRGKGKISRVKQKETSKRMSLFAVITQHYRFFSKFTFKKSSYDSKKTLTRRAHLPFDSSVVSETAPSSRSVTT